MSATVGETNLSHKERIEIGKQMMEVGQSMQKMVKDNPGLTNEQMSCIGLHGNVLAKLGSIFGSECDDMIKVVMDPSSAMLSLNAYFLLITNMIDNMKQISQIQNEEHKEKLTDINKDLIRLSVIATGIAKKNEDLVRSFESIINSKPTERESKVQFFNFTLRSVIIKLEGCFAEMKLIKQRIDEGILSVEAMKQQFFAMRIFKGPICKAAKMMVDIARQYPKLKIISGVLTAIGEFLMKWLNVKNPDAEEATKIRNCYKAQSHFWEQLDVILGTLNKELNNLSKSSQKEFSTY